MTPTYHADAIQAWADASPGGRAALRKKLLESADFADMIAASSADYATGDPDDEIGERAVYEYWTNEAAMLRAMAGTKQLALEV